MQPFHYERADSVASALALHDVSAVEHTEGASTYLAGGTTLLDLMKLDVRRPSQVIDLRALSTSHGHIRKEGDTLRLGAFARMAAVAEHPTVTSEFPAIAQSLSLAASAQLRNMATLGGNVLQATRCAYFRDPAWQACNRRTPGSGCAALEGSLRQHAVLGTSEHCIATYPGDFAQALIALDAVVMVTSRNGTRRVPFATLHCLPEKTPHVESRLMPGEIITEFLVPAGPLARRSRYLKVRDRQSYEFAVASAAVALAMEGDLIREARIALGGVASVPWRARAAEAQLGGQRLDETLATQVARTAFREATPRGHNAFKIPLGQATLVRALLETAALEV